ncbi:hypothetical protein D3C81_210200 [compost metagenome]
MSKRAYSFGAVIFGIILLVLGLVAVKIDLLPDAAQAVPYVLVGIGSGMFGHGMGEILRKRSLKNRPDLQREIEIAEKDERNIAVGNRAKAKAYDVMIYVFGALLLAFALMGTDLAEVLLLTASYLFVIGYGVFCRVKYEREM